MAAKTTFPADRIIEPDELIQEIKESNKHGGRFCFILGSGASKSSDIPLGTELEKIWMDSLMGVASDDDFILQPKVTERRAKDLFDAHKIDHSFEEIKTAWQNDKLTSELYFDIYKLRFYLSKTTGYRYLESMMEGIVPSLGYYYLAMLMVEMDQNNVVITTNFDSLLEDALFVLSKKRPLVAGHESLAPFISLNNLRPIIAKVHRSLFFDPFNSPETTNRLSNEWRNALYPVFNQYTPIVIGYGGGDKSLMPFLQEKRTKMNGIYWCYMGDNLPDEKIQKIVLSKDGCLVKIKGFDDLLLDIGWALFGKKIEPESIRNFLDNQMNVRVGQYKKQWDDNKNTEGMKKANRSFRESERRREKAGKLGYEDYVRRADRAEEKQDYETAVKEYSLAIGIQPQRAMAYNNRGYLYSQWGKEKEAIADLDEAIRLNPHFAEAYFNRGTVYVTLTKDYDKAIADFNTTISMMPDLVKAYNNRGYAYNNIGQYDKAIRDFNKVIKMNPKFAKAYCNRGYAYWQKGQYNKAIKDMDEAIKLNKQYSRAYFIRGCIYDKIGDGEQALRDLNEAKRLEPNNREYIAQLKNTHKNYSA